MSTPFATDLDFRVPRIQERPVNATLSGVRSSAGTFPPAARRPRASAHVVRRAA